MSVKSYDKDPQAVLDYAIDWNSSSSPGPWLATGETISAHTVTIAPAGLTKNSSTESSGKVTIWLSGGTDGATYTVTCHITTNQGRQDDRSIIIAVRNR